MGKKTVAVIRDRRTKAELLQALAETTAALAASQEGERASSELYQIELAELVSRLGSSAQKLGDVGVDLHRSRRELSAVVADRDNRIEENRCLYDELGVLREKLRWSVEAEMRVSRRLSDEVEGRAREQTLIRALVAVMAEAGIAIVGERVLAGAEMVGAIPSEVSDTFEPFIREEVLRVARAPVTAAGDPLAAFASILDLLGGGRYSENIQP